MREGAQKALEIISINLPRKLQEKKLDGTLEHTEMNSEQCEDFLD